MKTYNKFIPLNNLITRTVGLLMLLILCSCIQSPVPNEQVTTPTQVLSSATTIAATTIVTEIPCDNEQVNLFLENLDSAMTKVEKLNLDFSQTQNREEAMKIVEQTDNLYDEIFIWRTPDCVQDAHISLTLVVLHVANMEHAMIEGDMDAFNKEYKMYEIFLKQLNNDAKEIEDAVK